MQFALSRRVVSFVLGGAVLGALSVLSAPTASAQGTIAGQVTDNLSKEPLADAKLIVVGTTASATTSQDGRYRLSGVRAGSVDVQILRVGYTSVKRTVTVVSGQTLTLDIT